MKKLLLSLIACIMCWNAASAAPYQITDRRAWYFSAGAGFAIPTESDYSSRGNTFGIPVGTNGEIDPGLGASLSTAIGYTWNNWRFELEYAFRTFDFDIRSKNGGAASNFDASIHSIMANVAYDWFFDEKWYWYNGVGLGVGIAKTEILSGRKEADTAFAFQAMTGVGYEITKNLDIFLGYRLFRIADNKYSVSAVSGDVEIDAVWIHNIESGIRVRF